MQVLDLQHALAIRSALEELLQWQPTEAQAEIFLAALLRTSSPQARYDTWLKLSDVHEEVQHLKDGGDPGFDDMGDGHYVTLDRETALQRAEAELEEALDAAVGITPTQRAQAA